MSSDVRGRMSLFPKSAASSSVAWRSHLAFSIVLYKIAWLYVEAFDECVFAGFFNPVFEDGGCFDFSEEFFVGDVVFPFVWGLHEEFVAVFFHDDCELVRFRLSRVALRGPMSGVWAMRWRRLKSVRCVGFVFECVADDDGGGWVDVEFADAFAEFGGDDVRRL